MRIDSHQHFWGYNPEDYPWIDERMRVLRRDFLPEHLRPLLEGLGFQKSIAVQARQSLAETEWLLKLVEENDFIAGVVGWVDLRSPELGQQLENYARHPKLVGVRHVVQDEPDEYFVLQPDFIQGIARLGEFDLTYDLLVFPKQLPAAIKLVNQFPDQPFVVDHIAKPEIRDRTLSPWKQDIAELARFPNVYCKLSGMVTEAKWTEWRPEDFYPYLDVVIEAFGTSRLMIGSDWPVCTLAGDYDSVMGIVLKYIEQFPPNVREQILSATCAKFYGIT